MFLTTLTTSDNVFSCSFCLFFFFDLIGTYSFFVVASSLSSSVTLPACFSSLLFAEGSVAFSGLQESRVLTRANS